MIVETGIWLISEAEKIIAKIGSRKPTAKQRQQAAHLKARLGQWRRDFDELRGSSGCDTFAG